MMSSPAPPDGWRRLDPYPPLLRLRGDREQRAIFNNTLQRRREASYEQRLSKGCSLVLRPLALEPFAASVVKPHSSHEPQARRTLLQRLDSTTEVSDGKSRGFQLLDRVHAKHGQWSQVWRAGETSGKTGSLILKLYDDAQYPDMDFFNGRNNGKQQLWLPSPFAAANEAWVYEHLRSLQGSVIPQSCGFYEV